MGLGERLGGGDGDRERVGVRQDNNRHYRQPSRRGTQRLHAGLFQLLAFPEVGGDR
jgi:hypothetical protein